MASAIIVCILRLDYRTLSSQAILRWLHSLCYARRLAQGYVAEVIIETIVCRHPISGLFLMATAAL
jgi:hypothetical protein